MNFKLINFLEGISAISILPYAKPFGAAVQEKLLRAKLRAKVEGVSVDRAISLNTQEAIAGQIFYVLFTIANIGAVIWLSENTTWSEWAIGLLAVVPGALLVAAGWISRKFQRTNQLSKAQTRALC